MFHGYGTGMKPPAQSGDEPMKSIVLRLFKKAHVIGMFVLAVGLLATPVLMPSVGNAQDARVAKFDQCRI